jgi:hypothetical protein
MYGIDPVFKLAHALFGKFFTEFCVFYFELRLTAMKHLGIHDFSGSLFLFFSAD